MYYMAPAGAWYSRLYHYARRLVLMLATLFALALPAWAAPAVGPARLVKDINQRTLGSNPFLLTNVDGMVFFFIHATSTNTTELWKSDGTAQGTVRVKGGFDFITDPYTMEATAVDRTLFFVYDNELWKSDGTEAQTTVVKSFQPGCCYGRSIGRLISLNGTLFFLAIGPDGIDSLWRSDGTAQGTVRITGIVPCHGNPYECRGAITQ